MVMATFAMTGRQHDELIRHLFPGDGLEAVAFALCGRRVHGREQGLLVRQLVLVPHQLCAVRREDRVTWPTAVVLPLLEQAKAKGHALVKIHSHPTGYPRFSPIDDQSDRSLFAFVAEWLDDGQLHGSAVMLPDGRLFGRSIDAAGSFAPFSRIRVAGDDLHYWPGRVDTSTAVAEHGFARRLVQTFGSATYGRLRQLRIGVVGCSGTGSLVIEQLARNCVGELVLVDPKTVEERNLNRIPQATAEDAKARRLKVDVLERAVHAMGLGVRVTKHARSLHDLAVLRDLADCDAVFGCMDTVDGRHTLNRLAAFYLLPYFDVGVKLVADGSGNVDTVVGTVHYLQADGSSLLSRGVYTLDKLQAAALKRRDPLEYEGRRREGYIAGVDEERPAVISVNMLYASLAVNEFLARLHPYRIEPNGTYAVHRFSLSHGLYCPEADGAPCPVMARHAGRGDAVPFLDMPEFSDQVLPS